MNDLLIRFYSSVPLGLIWLGAFLGQSYGVTVINSVLFGFNFPHHAMSWLRRVSFTAILGGPILFAFALAVGSPIASLEHADGTSWFYGYMALCFFMGFGVAPLFQLAYWLRRVPSQQISVASQVEDVAQALGFKPIGRGKRAGLCRVPGNQVFEVEFNQKEFRMEQLPQAWDGLRILHLSDLHFCGTPDKAFFQWIVQRSLAEGVPDIVAISGDIVDSEIHHRWIVPVLGRLQWKSAGLAILGNHDCWQDMDVIRRRLRKARFEVLGNAWKQIEVRGEPMVVVGHEGPWIGTEPDMTGCPSGIFRLCLSHTPDQIFWAQKHRMDLVLAGHVHGGQIRMPLIGSSFVPSRFSRKYDCGTFFESPTLMHVSRGIGGKQPIRIRCRPEVTTIILRK